MSCGVYFEPGAGTIRAGSPAAPTISVDIPGNAMNPHPAGNFECSRASITIGAANGRHPEADTGPTQPFDGRNGYQPIEAGPEIHAKRASPGGNADHKHPTATPCLSEEYVRSHRLPCYIC